MFDVAGLSRADKIRAIAEAPIASLGLELADIEWVREGKARILRLIIDKDGGVSLDDCSAASRLVDPLIDRQPDLNQHDYLEVSSPGLERTLKTERDLIRYQGRPVLVTRFRAQDGSKTVKGRLAPCTDEEIRLDLADGTRLAIRRSDVARIKLNSFDQAEGEQG
jgi:ribosome maturation factor RimP